MTLQGSPGVGFIDYFVREGLGIKLSCQRRTGKESLVIYYRVGIKMAASVSSSNVTDESTVKKVRKTLQWFQFAYFY